MNGRKFLRVLLIVVLARAAFGGHRHRMGPRGGEKWRDHIEEWHRELHRRDAGQAQDVETGTAAPMA